MERREFIKSVGVFAAASVMPRLLPAEAKSKRPNIILVLVDDMGFSDIGCLGGEINTPVIDLLAKEGVLFTQCYNSARCTPSRGSLMTGLYPQQAGFGSNGTHSFKGKPLAGFLGEFSPDCVTIAEVLRSEGYKNYTAGKWHLCKTNDCAPGGSNNSWPLQRGFDKCYSILMGLGSFYDPGSLVRDNRFISPFDDAEYEPAQGDYYFTDAITDNVIKYVGDHCKETPEKPFFAYVSYNAPHFPLHAPQERIAKYKGKYDAGYEALAESRFRRARELGVIDKRWKRANLEASWEEEPDKQWFARCMEVYAAMVEAVDENVGRLVSELKEQGIYDNTLIFFLSDNGGCAQTWKNNEETEEFERLGPMSPEELQPDYIPEKTRDGIKFRFGKGVPAGPDGTYATYGKGWAQVSGSPFKGHKFQCYEGGIATGLIVSWPERVRPKATMTHFPAHLVDIMATCVDVSGAEYPKNIRGNAVIPMQGISLSPALAGGRLSREAPLFFCNGSYAAIRKGRWKLVLSTKSIDIHDDGVWELYDMVDDRTETTNLASQHPEMVSTMRKEWVKWGMENKLFPSNKLGDGTPEGTRKIIETGKL